MELLRNNSHLRALASEGDGICVEGPGRQVSSDDRSGLRQPYDSVATVTRQDQSQVAELPGAANAFYNMDEQAMAFQDASPGSSIMQMTGWGQFDSLVGVNVRNSKERLANSVFIRSLVA